MLLMSSFIAGSSNLHPERVLQVNEAGPLISSVKKSEISDAYISVFFFRDDVVRTDTPILATDESLRYTAAFNLLAFIHSRIGIITRFIFRGALL
jgi:hypothetical protein